MVGFYVLNVEKFKSLFISKDNRKNPDLLKKVFNEIKEKNNIITIAINLKSKRMKKIAEKNNFIDTKKVVIGKNNLKLNIFLWENKLFT